MLKTILKYITIVLLAFGLGTYYGWTSGFVDGRVAANGTVMTYVEGYSKARMVDDVAARDRAIELLGTEVAMEFVNGFSYSPLAYHFIHPKARYGLLKMAVTHELNQEFPSPWRKGKTLDLFSSGSSEAEYLERLKASKSDLYERIKKQTEAGRKKYLEKRSNTERNGAD